MAKLIRNRHGKRFSQVVIMKDGQLSTSKTGDHVGNWNIFGLKIYNGLTGSGGSVQESFEIEMNRAEAEANVESLAMMLGYRLIKEGK